MSWVQIDIFSALQYLRWIKFTLWFSKHLMNWWAVTQLGQRKFAQSLHLATAFSLALHDVQVMFEPCMPFMSKLLAIT